MQVQPINNSNSQTFGALNLTSAAKTLIEQEKGGKAAINSDTTFLQTWEEATNPNKTKHFPDCLRLQIYKTILLIIPSFKEGFFVLRSYRTEHIGPLGDGPRFGTQLRSYPIGEDTIYLLSKKRMRKIKTYYEIFIKKFHIIQFLKYFFTDSPLLLVLIRQILTLMETTSCLNSMKKIFNWLLITFGKTTVVRPIPALRTGTTPLANCQLWLL